MIQIAPSILSANFMRLGEEIKAAEQAGADLLHIDIMDGHFAPNITIGPAIVAAIRKITTLPLDVHLLIEDPDKFLSEFAQAGAGYLTVHCEAHRVTARGNEWSQGFRDRLPGDGADREGEGECLRSRVSQVPDEAMQSGLRAQHRRGPDPPRVRPPGT